MFVTDAHTGYKIFVADLQDELNFISIPATKNPGYITYDSMEKRIYWTDWQAERIFRADLDGGNREHVTRENVHGTLSKVYEHEYVNQNG